MLTEERKTLSKLTISVSLLLALQFCWNILRKTIACVTPTEWPEEKISGSIFVAAVVDVFFNFFHIGWAI